jgi:AraC family transcriptional regulator
VRADVLKLCRHQSFGDCSRELASAGNVIRDTLLAPQAQLPRHQHESPYVCITLGGHYAETAHGETTCGPGSVMTHPAGHEHANRTGAAAVRCVNVEFSPALLGDDALRPLLAREEHLRLAPSHAALTRLRCALDLRDSTAALCTLAAALDVVCAGLRQPAALKAPMNRVVDAIEADLARTPSLDELARVAGMHASHLSRSFRKTFGESVGGYLRRRRLETADALLMHADSSLADIAAAAGFCDQAHFTRVYARHFGLTPGRQRRVGKS